MISPTTDAYDRVCKSWELNCNWALNDLKLFVFIILHHHSVILLPLLIILLLALNLGLKRAQGLVRLTKHE